jgi:hypothetical protein
MVATEAFHVAFLDTPNCRVAGDHQQQSCYVALLQGVYPERTPSAGTICSGSLSYDPPYSHASPKMVTQSPCPGLQEYRSLSKIMGCSVRLPET